jgi:DNA polymerase I
MGLFDDVALESGIRESSWRPRELPSLAGIQHVECDTESTGLKWWGADRMIGYSFRASAEPWRGIGDSHSYYVPYGHRGPDNYSEEAAVRWAKDNLRGKDLYFLNAKHDVQFFRKAGVDLEALGNRIHDVGFMAALLDEERKRYNLADLAEERLGVSKLDLHRGAISGGKHLMAMKSAAEAGRYAERDAGLLRGLRDSYAPDIEAEDLWRVLALEDSLIWCVCEMERNATLIDEDLLDRWIRETQIEYEEWMAQLRRLVGAAINPNSSKDMLKLFVLLGIEPVLTPVLDKWGNPKEDPDTHEPVLSPSFSDYILERLTSATASNRVREALELCRDIRHIASLRSKYLLKYKRAIGPDGKARYSLNQLGQDDYGTVTGRFSASKTGAGEGYNPQQVFKPSRQKRVRAIAKYIVRRLFRPEQGRLWMDADAMQIEIRLAAHYAAALGMRWMADLYAADPMADMHDFVMGITKMNRDDTKNYSFMKLYGGGVRRAMEMTGRPEGQCRREIDQYDAAFPEFKTMMNKVSDAAKERGYVRTTLGRRRHCPERKKLHAMLNAVIQGSAGDVMKLKMVEAYDARKDLGLTAMRLTVHDSLCSDVDPDPAVVARTRELLNVQSIKFHVPILWDVNVGPNWAEVN